MNDRYLIIATLREKELPWAQHLSDTCEVILTGVGGTNIVKACRDLPRYADIYNVGFAGAAGLPVGSVQWVRESRLWHPTVTFDEPVFKLRHEGVTCYTAGDFIDGASDFPLGAVCDMELAYICAFGFRSVTSIKYISDNLSLQDYERQD